MERHWLITVHDLPLGDHPDAPPGIPAEAKIVLRSVLTPNDGFGRTVYEDKGWKQELIAERFGITQVQVSSIVRREAWPHI